MFSSPHQNLLHQQQTGSVWSPSFSQLMVQDHGFFWTSEICSSPPLKKSHFNIRAFEATDSPAVGPSRAMKMGCLTALRVPSTGHKQKTQNWTLLWPLGGRSKTEKMKDWFGMCSNYEDIACVFCAMHMNMRCFLEKTSCKKCPSFPLLVPLYAPTAETALLYFNPCLLPCFAIVLPGDCWQKAKCAFFLSLLEGTESL